MQLDIQGVTAAEAREFIAEGLLRRRDKLQAQIDGLTNGQTAPKSGQGVAKSGKKASKTAKSAEKAPRAKGKLSAKGRAAIAKAQQERWARIKAAKNPVAAEYAPDSEEIASPVGQAPVESLA